MFFFFMKMKYKSFKRRIYVLKIRFVNYPKTLTWNWKKTHTHNRLSIDDILKQSNKLSLKGPPDGRWEQWSVPKPLQDCRSTSVSTLPLATYHLAFSEWLLTHVSWVNTEVTVVLEIFNVLGTVPRQLF